MIFIKIKSRARQRKPSYQALDEIALGRARRYGFLFLSGCCRRKFEYGQFFVRMSSVDARGKGSYIYFLNNS